MIPDLPDVIIKDGDVVAVDLETYDPELKKHGSGSIINKGKVVGIALAYNDKKFYFPIRHSDTVSNLAPNLVWKVLNKKIFQNKTKDKDNVIMGIMHKKYNVHGVQFHPESIKTPIGLKLLKNFINYK